MPKGMAHKMMKGGNTKSYSKTGAMAGSRSTKYVGVMKRHGSTKKTKSTKSY